MSAIDAATGSIPGSTTDFGEGQLDTPHLALVAQSIFANELQLSVPTIY
jgi:hypothetical protein